MDDNFIGNKRKAKELLREIVLFQIAHEYPFSFYTEASVDLAGDEELLDLMADAGFSMVFVGIETPDSAILEQSHKTQNTRQDLLTSVDIIQRKGIQVLAGFILGFDNETTDIFDRQIEEGLHSARDDRPDAGASQYAAVPSSRKGGTDSLRIWRQQHART
ncbi:MAG: B12-binding domain-containing radical SAM protein [Spirochaetota bacterium]